MPKSIVDLSLFYDFTCANTAAFISLMGVFSFGTRGNLSSGVRDCQGLWENCENKSNWYKAHIYQEMYPYSCLSVVIVFSQVNCFTTGSDFYFVFFFFCFQSCKQTSTLNKIAPKEKKSKNNKFKWDGRHDRKQFSVQVRQLWDEKHKKLWKRHFPFVTFPVLAGYHLSLWITKLN